MGDRLKDRVALVFGAGSCGPGWGNGKAAAVAYAREGAKVVAVDLYRERADETRDTIVAEGGAAISLAANVVVAQDVQRVVTATVADWGRIDILHNNVGIGKIGSPVDLEEEEWDRVLDTNLKSVFLTCKFVLPLMVTQGAGVITNISSILSVRFMPYPTVAYSASKAGLNQFTRAIAAAYASKGIRSNAILPGLMDTPVIHQHTAMTRQFGGEEEKMRQRHAMVPMGRMGDAWDTAQAAVFLASDEASYVNGVLLPIDGALGVKAY